MKCFICHKEIAESLFNDNVPPMCSNECHRINFWNEKAEKYAKNGKEKTQKKTIIQDKEHTLHYQSITSTSYSQKTKENNYGYTEKTLERSS